ncbi:hypothetical protein B0H63DRAFT_485497 [Podospora didyma]|uniref:Uncharacterized protein n=1 Tax=Podospora didyma TaxID=330526 RepID=A0AAE0N752_9PEZI|nr:hypothetical protein B0H63DRAFT_485497 [Podospora didyma]
MKFQLLTTISTLLALGAAIPAPQGPHNLIPDTDDFPTDTDTLVARAPEPLVTVPTAASNYNFTSDFNYPLDALLSEIDAIPDSVLEAGDEALHKYLVSHGLRAPDAKLRRDTPEADFSSLEGVFERAELVARVSIWKIAKCVAAIVQLLATTAVPAAKLLRIKKYLKALGGTKQAVQLLLKATTRAEKLKVGGEALVNLAAELLGISSVKNNCF